MNELVNALLSWELRTDELLGVLQAASPAFYLIAVGLSSALFVFLLPGHRTPPLTRPASCRVRELEKLGQLFWADRAADTDQLIERLDRELRRSSSPSD